MKHRKRVRVKDLQVGMRLMSLDRPWMETPFLWHRMVLRDEGQIAKVIACGARYAEIETEELSDEGANEKIEAFEHVSETRPPLLQAAPSEPVPFAEELA